VGSKSRVDMSTILARSPPESGLPLSPPNSP
jgi:hypothetical protein